MKTSETTTKIWTAVLSVQKSLGAVKKSGKNTHTRSSYATLSDVLSLVRPALNDSGIVLAQHAGRSQDSGDFGVFTRLVHAESGEFIETFTEISVDASAKNAAHARGSAITYGSRYGISSLLGIECVDDDDGNAAGSTSVQDVQRKVQNISNTYAQKKGLPGVYELTQDFKDFVRHSSLADLKAEYSRLDDAQKAFVLAEVEARKALEPK